MEVQILPNAPYNTTVLYNCIMRVIKDRVAFNTYMREYMIKRYHRRRQEAIVLLGGKCAKCGSTEQLEFDHTIRSSKTGELAKIWGYKQKRFLEELAKCQLLCNECHKAKTLVDKGFNPGKGHHGSLASYRYCKCDLCKKAASDHNRAYRAKRMAGRGKYTPRFAGIKHGTYAGYAKEVRTKVPRCDACKLANCAYARQRRIQSRTSSV